MELRRTVLLFAIVLCLAAIAASFSRAPEGARDDAAEAPPAGPSRPTARPRPAGPRPVRIAFSSSSGRPVKRLRTGRAATITVKVARPGEVELEGLGVSAPADPLTPARFELLESRPGRYPVRFTPSAGREARTLGGLEIVP